MHELHMELIQDSLAFVDEFKSMQAGELFANRKFMLVRFLSGSPSAFKHALTQASHEISVM